MFQRIGRRPRRTCLAASAGATVLALVLPGPAQAWYDIPVRAPTETVKALRAERIDTRQLADILRTAADPLDEEAAQARGEASRACPRCTWSVAKDRQGAFYIRVRLGERAAEAEIDSALEALPALPPVRRSRSRDPQ